MSCKHKYNPASGDPKTYIAVYSPGDYPGSKIVERKVPCPYCLQSRVKLIAERGRTQAIQDDKRIAELEKQTGSWIADANRFAITISQLKPKIRELDKQLAHQREKYGALMRKANDLEKQLAEWKATAREQTKRTNIAGGHAVVNAQKWKEAEKREAVLREAFQWLVDELFEQEGVEDQPGLVWFWKGRGMELPKEYVEKIAALEVK